MNDGTAGPRSATVLEYTTTMRDLVPGIRDGADWAPLAAFVAVDRFQRIGTFLEVQDWSQYTGMLTKWAASVDSFETDIRRVTETGNLVFYEIEERHHRAGAVHVVNSMTVFEFDTDGRIERLSVYLQQRAA